MIRSLYGRLALVFALLTLACGGFTAWLYQDMAARHQQEVLQRLSRDLAGHIASHSDLVKELKWNRPAVEQLFHMLMVVNPGIEVYLIKANGHVDAHVAPPGAVKRQWVDLAPIRAYLAGGRFPLLGDDPRSTTARKIFSVAPCIQDGHTVGYLYVVLAGEAYDRLAADVWASRAVSGGAALLSAMLALSLVAGLVAFALITKPLRRLTGEVAGLDAGELRPPQADQAREGGDEIGQLRRTFRRMAERIAAQMGELKRQDEMRREMVANISHDLRTPLTSLQGYLETLTLKAGQLSEEDRNRYLDVAVRQSRKVSHLAQELFELARLECDVVKPQKERFALAELVQDVLQKFELAAREKGVALRASVAPELPAVMADLGMIERVLTNLLDNALRHTPAGGWVAVELTRVREGVGVRVSDNGGGIPAEIRADLFERPSPLRGGDGRASGGLGLLIVKRILKLHDCVIRLDEKVEAGAAFSFALPAAA
jgi:signal transduction histidine kinase